MTYDAIVIGAGPAGSTAARLLAQAGWSVAVVEKTRFPRRKVCGEFISATSLPLVQDGGIAGEFFASAGPEIRRVGLFARDVVLSSPMPRVDGSAWGWGRALGRDRLDSLLVDAAVRAGAKLFQPWKLSALRRTELGHCCTISSGSESIELIAPVLIAANGSWEHGPLSAAQAGAHSKRDLLAFKARFRNSELPADLMPLLVFPGGYGGMVHTDGDCVSLSCCIRRDVLERCRRDNPGSRAADATLVHILKNCEGVRSALLRAELDGAWLSAGPIQPGIRRPFSDGIFFAGNIAGEAHPIVAEGISMAMQSAWLLCRRLTADQNGMAHGNLAEIGKAYSRDWKRSFAPRIRAAATFAHIAMRPNAFVGALPILKSFPKILTWGAQLSGKSTRLVRA
jgi:flavin-dependent dehydrogenase